MLPAGGVAIAAPVTSLRLYVFDCGTIVNLDLARFRLERSEVARTDLAVPCFLICHPKGNLLWEAGAAPDEEWREPSAGGEIEHRVVLPDGSQRQLRLRRHLLTQLAETGFKAADITHLAFSHYHWDHSANVSAFAHATWLVRREDHDVMFGATAPAGAKPSYYAALRGSKTIVIDAEEHDVFGDGTVILKSASGHTPGHQVLFVRLPKTGPIVLSGDLYHYAENRALRRVPVFEASQDATVASRKKLEEFLRQQRAQLWIQHDAAANTTLRKAPEFYD